MPYYETSQEWLRQSTLLLEARPTTTRVTTKYHISQHLCSRPSRAASKAASTSTSTSDSDPKPPRGVLTLKTHDTRSGATLKYRTTKAAEVSRLVLSLGRLGRRMAGLPRESEADEPMADAAAVAAGEGISRAGTPAAAAAVAAEGKQGQGQGQSGGGGGGGSGGGKGKKKRGKK